MKIKHYKLHLHMFDGAAADGGAATSAAESGTSQQESKPEVVYGKAEDNGESGQIGDGQNEEEPEEETPEDVFERLIKGEYKEQFDARVHQIMQKRFKNAQDSQGIINDYEDATALLMAKYGLKKGDVKGLKNAIEHDDGFFDAAAEADGITADKYRENLRLKIDAENGRRMTEEFRREAQKRETFQRWDAEAEALKEAFPNFDLALELENQAFLDSLNRGNDVRQSFYIAHMDEILAGSAQKAASDAQEQTVNNIKKRAARPSENSSSSQPAVIRKDDPSKMTDDDLFEIARRVRSGENIKF